MPSKAKPSRLGRDGKQGLSIAAGGKPQDLEEIANCLDKYVAEFTKRGMLLTAHFLDLAALDLKCRLKGISEHEIATLALLARRTFEQKWAGRRVIRSAKGNNS